MKIRAYVEDGVIIYNALNVSEDELSLIHKALMTNWDHDNFISEDQETLCEHLIDKLNRVLPKHDL